MKTSDRERFLDELRKHPSETITTRELVALGHAVGIGHPSFYTNDPANRISRGKYRVPASAPALQAAVITMPTRTPKASASVEESMIPKKYEHFVPFGNFDDLKQIIQSQQFYPVFITGHSGTGKTFAVEQACAQLKRKFICISMTPETDEGDLLGNFVLIDNSMVWKDGPVTVAAKEGAILCLDEIDYGASNLTTLQRVLEGKPFLLKKKNEMIEPSVGFNIIATANTKGKGSDDGRYMFTNVLNEAFLERFPIMFEQEWAPKSFETRIIRKELKAIGMEDDMFATMLVDWAGIIRKTFTDGGCQDVISTRRLVHITKAYSIFKNRIKAIQYCLNRFDKETTTSFLDLYTKLDVTVAPVANTEPTVEQSSDPAAAPVQSSGATITSAVVPIPSAIRDAMSTYTETAPIADDAWASIADDNMNGRSGSSYHNEIMKKLSDSYPKPDAQAQDSVEAGVKDVIAQVYNVSLSTISDQTSLTHLRGSSFDAMAVRADLARNLSARFNITVPLIYQIAAGWRTVGDVIATVHSLPNDKTV